MTLVLDILTTAAILYGVSAGLLIVFGVMKIINFAHGAFLTVGGYAALLVTNLGWNPWWSLPVAFAIGGFLGALVERLVMKPLYQRPLDAILATWGLAIVMGQCITLVFDRGVQFVQSPLSGAFDFAGASYSSYRLLMIPLSLALAYAPQEKPLFHDLSVEQNLQLGLRESKSFNRQFERVADVFPVLATRLKQRAGTLSGGEQKMLLIARALLSAPALILIDEITEGLQPSVIERLAAILRSERERSGTAMLLVEQNVSFALSVADRQPRRSEGPLAPRRCRADHPTLAWWCRLSRTQPSIESCRIRCSRRQLGGCTW